MTLGEYTGLLLSDFLHARQQTDALAAAISEDYHIDPLMSGIPVPRYTIEEAEIDAPVQIVGVRCTESDSELDEQLLQRLRSTLPMHLLRSLKNAYYQKQTAQPNQAGDPAASANPQESASSGIAKLSDTPELQACYRASVISICLLMEQYMSTYLKENNTLGSLQLLDFMDVFEAVLFRECKKEFDTYSNSDTPYANMRVLKTECELISRKMLKLFKNVIEKCEGLLIDPQTGKMGNSVNPDCIMRVKLKLRSQDLDFIVDKDESGESHRILSIN